MGQVPGTLLLLVSGISLTLPLTAMAMGNGLVDRQSLFVSLCNSAFETKQINLNENWEVKKKRKKIMRQLVKQRIPVYPHTIWFLCHLFLLRYAFDRNSIYFSVFICCLCAAFGISIVITYISPFLWQPSFICFVDNSACLFGGHRVLYVSNEFTNFLCISLSDSEHYCC